MQRPFVKHAATYSQQIAIFRLNLVDIIAPQYHWRSRLRSLIALHALPVAAMGLPQDWKQRTIWQVQP